MPYIKPEWKNLIDEDIRRLSDNISFCFDSREIGGVLNYVITRLILYNMATTINYNIIERVRGLLDGIKHEFNRRVADPYEDLKIAENGDVYEN